MHFTDIIYIVISKISNIRQKYKNNPIVKEKAQVSWVISYLMHVWNMKTIRLKLLVKMYSIVTLYYSKISKIRQKFKIDQIVKKKSMSQMRDIIFVACIKCKSYLIETVGEDAFCS